MPSIALVTGSSKGIGHEIIAQLAARRMICLLAARDVARGEQAAGELRARGGDVHAITLDVTDPECVAAAAADVAKRFGRLDVLVNNAGIGGELTQQNPSTADLGTVRSVFETNFFGVINVTNAMVPLLRRSTAGRIVNISSGLGSLTRMTDPCDDVARRPPLAGYVPSKTALNSLTVQYAKELRNDGILVNAADPGPCATDITKGFAGLTRTAANGAAVAVRLATVSADGPTGGFFNEDGPASW